MMTAQQMEDALNGVAPGAMLFVSYVAGREPTALAIDEARPHTENPTRSRRHFVGTLSSVWTAKNGDPIMTIKAHNRGLDTKGAYRSFNPNLGTLLSVQVLS